MELKLVFILIRRWLWLLIIGAVAGLGVGYLYNEYQIPVYRATAKVMIMGPLDELANDSSSRRTSMDELVNTYTQLLLTSPILSSVSEQIGVPLSTGQIKVQQVAITPIFQIQVEASDPEKAAMAANGLVASLINQNEKLLADRFGNSSSGLQAQIQEIEGSIERVQDEIAGISQVNFEKRKVEIENQIKVLETEIINLKREVLNLTAEFYAETQPVATQTIEGTAAATTEGAEIEENAGTNPNLATTLTAEQQAILVEKESQMAWREELLAKYRDLYFDLTTRGDASTIQNLQSSSDLVQLNTQLNLYQEMYTQLLSDYETSQISSLNNTPNIVQIEEARIPRNPISPILATNLTIFGSLGLLTVMIIAFFIEYLDDSLKSGEAVSAILRTPVIGYIARTPEINHTTSLYVSDSPRSPFAESLRSLRANLEFTTVDNLIKTLLVTSALPSDGKTTISANLAEVIAQAGQRVIIIDSDLRKPNLHRFYQLPNNVGLTSVLLGHIEIEEALQSTKDSNVRVLTSGPLPPNPTELLGTESMSRILTKLTSMADIIVTDGPPFVVSDPSVLANKVDGVLVVVRSGQTEAGAVKAMAEQLNRAKAKVIGAVLNDVSSRSYYGYGYYNNSYPYLNPKKKFKSRWPFAKKLETIVK